MVKYLLMVDFGADGWGIVESGDDLKIIENAQNEFNYSIIVEVINFGNYYDSNSACI